VYNYLSKEMKIMSMALKIKMILLERDMTIKQLSEKLGYKGNNLYNKLDRDNLSEKELKKIADALDCDYDGIFTFRDTGKQI
jgi:DNA-binding Xre family transcriptional regulator